MKKAGFVLVIGLFLLVYAYVFAQEEVRIVEVTAPARGLIKGTVTDTQTPRPNRLADATVAVEGKMLLRGLATKTDSAGNYEISNLPPGEYIVRIAKPGYNDSIGYITVTPGGESFHNVRLYHTDTPITYFCRTRAFSWPLVFCSLLLLLSVPIAAVYIIKRIRKLAESKSKIGEAFTSRVREALQNDDMLGAISTCDEVDGLANILKAGLLRYAELSGKGDVAGEGVQQTILKKKIQEAIEKAGATAKREFEFHWSLIATMFGAIGGMALLYGFLGMVIWTNRAYITLARMGTGDPTMLAGGISDAWLIAAFGLAIAVISTNLCLIAFIIYKIFEKKANALISRTQRTFAEMINSL